MNSLASNAYCFCTNESFQACIHQNLSSMLFCCHQSNLLLFRIEPGLSLPQRTLFYSLGPRWFYFISEVSWAEFKKAWVAWGHLETKGPAWSNWLKNSAIHWSLKAGSVSVVLSIVCSGASLDPLWSIASCLLETKPNLFCF